MTNTQVVVDAPHKDLRRARAASMSLIPTTTGSATAIGLIFPELQGKLDGLAVRVPLLNASLTDAVFEVARPTTVEEVNGCSQAAADGPLDGILGYEERPLVSVDFKDDPRSGIVDAPSTMVTDGTQVKVLAWYDNEWGYANRLVELARTVGSRPVSRLRNYALVTGAYWADTIADGAIRILVLFYFYELGYSPFEVASLFLFYELFGIVTNLVGGFLAARLGLKATLVAGLGTQLVALTMLAVVPESWLVVPYVMVAQALSGIAKDLTKMSSKSAVKLVVPQDEPGALYKWVAVLTGSKNALKGVGFFVGGLLLSVTSFQTGLLVLAGLVGAALAVVLALMRGDLSRPDPKAKFRQMFSNSRAVNLLAAARIFLFASRDVWFVVGLPVYLRTVLGWSFWEVGAFLAVWVIGYGVVQASRAAARRATPTAAPRRCSRSRSPLFPAGIAIALAAGVDPTVVLVGGPHRVRRDLRDELRGPLVPDPRLRRRRRRSR